MDTLHTKVKVLNGPPPIGDDGRPKVVPGHRVLHIGYVDVDDPESLKEAEESLAAETLLSEQQGT